MVTLTDAQRLAAVAELELVERAAKAALVLLPRRHDRWSRELILDVARSAARVALAEARNRPL